MPDPIFTHPRLVAIYDHFDGERTDLEPYLQLAKDLGARTVLDLGCGTGRFARLLAAHGFQVTAADPATASIDFARSQVAKGDVRWICGTAADLPDGPYDLAVMTGNVAQVFVSDHDWEQTLRNLRASLRPGGHLIFETRDPAREAWKNWNPETTLRRLHIPGIGEVEGWCELTGAHDETVSFRWHYVFASAGTTLTSDSTLRFRPKESLVRDLERTGFEVREIRGAPDRPGLEFVFIATVNTRSGAEPAKKT